LLAAGCSAQTAGEAEYPSTNCSRVALIDSATGASVRGAEDLDIDAARGRLIVSAYDRRAAEKAAHGPSTPPEGGLYVVRLERLGGAEAAATPLVPPGAIAGGLRPHGVAYISTADEIAFVNRAYAREGRGWRLAPRIERVGAADGSRLDPLTAHCAANDLVATEAGLLVTFDHGACDWRAGLEDVLSLRRAGVVPTTGGEPLFSGASYANGVIAAADGALALAATRENALLMLRLSEDGAWRASSRVKLPGGPDNLTRGDSGRIIAAVHPSTLRLAAARKLGLGKASSRIVAIDPATGGVALLFDDPTGKVFSAATVAVEREGALILGSVLEEGLLVCRRSSAPKS
jgi:hypothetical protein